MLGDRQESPGIPLSNISDFTLTDVQIWGVRKRPNRVAAYQVLWRVATRPFSKSYKIKAQADGRRSELPATVSSSTQKPACPPPRCKRSTPLPGTPTLAPMQR